MNALYDYTDDLEKCYAVNCGVAEIPDYSTLNSTEVAFNETRYHGFMTNKTFACEHGFTTDSEGLILENEEMIKVSCLSDASFSYKGVLEESTSIQRCYPVKCETPGPIKYSSTTDEYNYSYQVTYKVVFAKNVVITVESVIFGSNM